MNAIDKRQGQRHSGPPGTDARNARDMTGEAGMDAEGYRALMRHQAGAVTVIATGAGSTRAGLTATAVASLSDHPPTILACVQLTAGAHDLIVTSGVFSVNVLSARQQAIAEVFAGRHGLKGAARFAHGSWTTLATGAPVLADALAVLDCRLVERHDFTTHSIFIGRVLAGRFDDAAEPLLYFRNDFWDLGQR